MFQSDAGCDSLVTLTLTIPDIETTVTNSDVVVTGLALGAEYLWIDRSNGFTPLPGASSKSFNADAGEYAVIITQNSCSDTSACHKVSLVVGFQNEMEGELTVFPNPAGDLFLHSCEKPEPNGSLEMININGRTIKTHTFQQQSLAEVDTRGLASGAYTIRVQTSNGISTMKLIKKE